MNAPRIVTDRMARAERGIAERLRLPPFGKALMELREAGLVPADNRVVLSLDSWSYGKALARVVIPEDLAPEDCNLAFVAGLDVILVWEPHRTVLARRDALIRTTLRCLPTTLRVLAIADPIEWQWIKSRAVGIELSEFQE